jgi:hypothetical protein
MPQLATSLENWLIAERQLMSRPDALTAFLNDRLKMLDGIAFDPQDPLNTGAAKSRSHINQCGHLLRVIESARLDPPDRSRQLGVLAAKSLKVASGYSMRAGYFHPSEPAELYRDRMIRLVDADGQPLPVLGRALSELEGMGLAAAGLGAQDSIEALESLFEVGQRTASQADENLRELLSEERLHDPAFSGDTEAQRAADTLTVIPKSLFVALGIGALRIQGEGPDSLGPLILEPQSSANAQYFLRADRLEASVVNQVTQVSSPDMVLRGGSSPVHSPN